MVRVNGGIWRRDGGHPSRLYRCSPSDTIGSPVASERLIESRQAASCSRSRSACLILPASQSANVCCSLFLDVLDSGARARDWWVSRTVQQ